MKGAVLNLLDIICKHCSSLNFCKKGFRKTNHRGKIQNYYCNDCKRFFTKDDSFYRMRNKPEIITMSIDMYISNLLSRKMKNQLNRHLNTKISHMSILDWVRRYTLKVSKFVDKLSYNMGSSFYADETLIDCTGRDDRFWCCIDWDTLLIIGFHYSLSGNPIEAQKFLFKSIQKGKPKFIQTVGGVFYPRAFRKLFYSNTIDGLTVEHKIQNASVTKIHNYLIETVFMKIKDRMDDLEG